MEPTITPLAEDDVDAVAAFIAHGQADPATHITYLASDAPTIAAELAQAAAWRGRTLVARDQDRVVGVVQIDIDDEMRRAWWIGPWAEDPAVATALVDEAAARFGDGWSEEEFAPDARNPLVAAVATARGCTADPGSAILSLALPGPPRAAVGHDVRPLDPADVEVVVALHDALFPGTHTGGSRLVADPGTTVHVTGPVGAATGYVATQIQADGTGYIDFLGVAEAARGAGIGRALISAAVDNLARAGAPTVNLTVREANKIARGLYVSLGFTEERIAVPYRLGFHLP